MSGAPLHNGATTPNSQLSSVELAERKRLKRQANQRRKEERVQTKALNRAYKGTDAARAEWKRYGWKEQVELSYTGYAQAMPRRTRLSNSTANCDPIRQAASDSAKQLVEQMVAAYDSSSVKSVEEAHTNELLAHMVKGTQEAGMFTVPSIIGYTRRKFVERALDTFDSLRLLHETVLPGCLSTVILVVSVGCGPGNDLYGGTLALRNFVPSETPLVLVGCDYVVEKWRCMLEFVAQACTQEVSLNDGNESASSSSVLASADITKALAAADNHALHQVLSERSAGSTVYIFSYILSETHGKWSAFVCELLAQATPGDIFLFSEAVAWQLHELIGMFPNWIKGKDYFWLDSSYDVPEMQDLMNREGPGVVAVVKHLEC